MIMNMKALIKFLLISALAIGLSLGGATAAKESFAGLPLDEKAYCLSVLPTDTEKMLAVHRVWDFDAESHKRGYLSKRTGPGQWESVNLKPAGPMSVPLKAESVIMVAEEVYFLGTGGQGFWVTPNSGANWIPRRIGLPTEMGYYIPVQQVFHRPGNPYVIYLIIGPESRVRGGEWRHGRYLYKSIDLGVSWTQVWDGGPEQYNDKVNHIAFHPTNPDTMFMGTQDNLWKSVDAGSTWAAVGPYTTLGANQMYVTSSRVWAAPMNYYGLLMSDAGGEPGTWQYTALFPGYIHVNHWGVVVDPADDLNIYVGIGSADYNFPNEWKGIWRWTGYEWVQSMQTTYKTQYFFTMGNKVFVEERSSAWLDLDETTWFYATLGQDNWVEVDFPVAW